MSSRNLSRVRDLEGSPEWMKLADEINDLEKMCHLNNHRHSRKPLPKYQNCEKHSVPQVQKATSVWIDDFESNRQCSPDRWNWKPKTEFERSYFFDEYQNQFEENAQKPYSFAEECQRDQGRSSNEEKPSTTGCKGTRERLHEIFERNRYLRRQFFSNYANDCPKDFDTRKKCNNGFGSTETLTSQSNQSSISSIDRKPRSRVNVTPELEEESPAGEYSKNTLSSFRDLPKNCLSPDDAVVSGTDVRPWGIAEATLEKEKESASRVSEESPSRIYLDHRLPNRRAGSIDTKSLSPKTLRDNCDSNGTKFYENHEIPKHIFASSSSKEKKSQSLCKSLPDLSFLQTTRPVQVCCFKSHMGSSEKLKENHARFASQADLPSLSRSMSLRRVKITKIPAPLDLSKVNEEFEELQALENVDVSLIRDYDRPMNGLPTVIKDECSDDDACKENSSSSFSVGHSAKCPDGKGKVWATMEELQSPQLVYNSKNSIVDTGNDTSQQRSRPAELAGALSDQVNSISGASGTGTTLPSVYGPIPYKFCHQLGRF
ncbi:uncharacterized protein LOC143356050 [Halictus rubicundus]|uniref:uncharacterized protein LOC143356050 n=1 Tax=Halictus rubicundus TaxID=77578 RepID=UPI00403608ED